MNSKFTISLIKVFVLFGGIAGLIGRNVIADSFINYYMAIINSASFIISYNILLIDMYTNLKQTYKNSRANFIKISAKNVVMIFYIMIFLINLILWGVLARYYFFVKIDYALINDILGISSLCLAITYDFISLLAVKMLTVIFIK